MALTVDSEMSLAMALWSLAFCRSFSQATITRLVMFYHRNSNYAMFGHGSISPDSNPLGFCKSHLGSEGLTRVSERDTRGIWGEKRGRPRDFFSNAF